MVCIIGSIFGDRVARDVDLGVQSAYSNVGVWFSKKHVASYCHVCMQEGGADLHRLQITKILMMQHNNSAQLSTDHCSYLYQIMAKGPII